MTDSKKVIMPLQKWLLEAGRCSSCGSFLSGLKKEKQHSRVVVRCSCSHLFEYYPREHYFQKVYLTVGD